LIVVVSTASIVCSLQEHSGAHSVFWRGQLFLSGVWEVTWRYSYIGLKYKCSLILKRIPRLCELFLESESDLAVQRS